MEETSVFFSKILLFGEYSVIKKSMALATPYDFFEGALRVGKEQVKRPDPDLKSLVEYLKKLKFKDNISFDFDLRAFELDVLRGLFFDSSIPRGFGMGSSGALCAALYKRYAPQVKDHLENIPLLKRNLSLLESYFHGSSSGTDPLTSYLGKSLLLKGNDSLDVIKIPKYEEGSKGLFLLNSGQTRKTDSLVGLFLEKLKKRQFEQMVEDRLLPVTNACIKSFLQRDIKNLLQHFYDLSCLQMKYLAPMIPGSLKELWEEGLKSGDYYLKLCGAGGGGFLLGVTRELNVIQKWLTPYPVKILYRFE